ncbi:hypothetical protein LTT66_05215 [Nocardia gipuzkoensis]|uniref:hypothetical protein n=1 Tax=Nocardia gipuzkoensis TaxID=2749991 RepID=UPI001E5340FF|nr:hypothetical protein [Nocardia gipuzkoensis]UGT69594.1 hypothetical protein LTT66_05215 [Nocardia gipuzkoensis]
MCASRTGTSSTACAPFGEAGRVLDKHAFTALGWRPDTRLELACLDSGVLSARPTVDGPVAMTAGGFFRIPYRLRRRVSLFIGDRALLIGHRVSQRLLIHPPAALDELCAPSLNQAQAVQ